jgi:raffinose/stachyose/melibiose transport system permease protein
MATTNIMGATAAATGVTGSKKPRMRQRMKSMYPSWFFIPGIALYVIFFGIPTFASFYYAFTRWDLSSATWIGLDNFVNFFQNPQLINGFIHTFEYGFATSAAKVILGFLFAIILTSPIIFRGYLRAIIFFPVLLSTIGVGIMFKSLLDPFHGMVNAVLGFVHLPQPGWFTDPSLALATIAGVDIWKGVGIATLIFMAGIVAIPSDYFEAARMDGASSWRILRDITLPLSRPAMATVIILSLIGGLRSFDIIWATTGGGPGFTSDVIASVIYKQYQAGFFGLSTAGNVVLFIVVTAIMVPLTSFLNRKTADL